MIGKKKGKKKSKNKKRYWDHIDVHLESVYTFVQHKYNGRGSRSSMNQRNSSDSPWFIILFIIWDKKKKEKNMEDGEDSHPRKRQKTIPLVFFLKL